jgi:phytanoyl-CoA hydroxylase
MWDEGNVFRIHAPDGAEIEIPTAVDDATDIYLSLQDNASRLAYYQTNGYVVIRNLIPTTLCDRVKQTFEAEIKPYNGYLYRQTSSGAAEKHQINEHGYVLNALMNILNLNETLFPNFWQAITALISHSNLYEAVHNFLGEPGIIVQSMYFEGNPQTWAHQDTYYLDAAQTENMTAAWIALEDIQPTAGRFYVYPESQHLNIVKNSGKFDIAFNHMSYKQHMLDMISKYQLKCCAPALRKGDVLFWTSKTIHGSLETLQPQFSRSSLTTHFIPASAGFLQFQSRLRKLHLRQIGAFQVDCSKNQNRLKYKLLFKLELIFPKFFSLTKKIIIKLFTK